jgi:hypothetical protein
MTTLDCQVVEEALHAAGLSWLVQYWGAEKSQFLQKTTEGISEFIGVYESRFKERPDPIRLLDENPIRGRAFFQFDTLVASTEMKVMIWRILQGCEVARVEFHYDRAATASLDVELRTPFGERENYSSSYWADFRVLRHFGTVSAGEQLRLEGYYASR